VYNLARTAGLPGRPIVPRLPPAQEQERNAAIREAVSHRTTYAEIGAKYGLTYERVRQILLRAGITMSQIRAQERARLRPVIEARLAELAPQFRRVSALVAAVSAEIPAPKAWVEALLSSEVRAQVEHNDSAVMACRQARRTDIGLRLRQAVERSGLNRKQVADAARCSYELIGAAVEGRPASDQALIRMAQAVNVPAAWLLDGVGEPW
jgi:hypothetical protein